MTQQGASVVEALWAIQLRMAQSQAQLEEMLRLLEAIRETLTKGKI